MTICEYKLNGIVSLTPEDLKRLIYSILIFSTQTKCEKKMFIEMYGTANNNLMIDENQIACLDFLAEFKVIVCLLLSLAIL